MNEGDAVAVWQGEVLTPQDGVIRSAGFDITSKSWSTPTTVASSPRGASVGIDNSGIAHATWAKE